MAGFTSRIVYAAAHVVADPDASVVGFNDEAIGQDVFPALTTVSIPHMELGREAVRLAPHRTEPSAVRDQHVMLGTHVVVRHWVRAIIHRR